MNSASLCSLAGRYDNLVPPRFLGPIDCLNNSSSEGIADHEKCGKVARNQRVTVKNKYHTEYLRLRHICTANFRRWQIYVENYIVLCFD